MRTDGAASVWNAGARSASIAGLGMALSLGVMGGCNVVSGIKFQETQRQLLAAQEQIKQFETQLVEQHQTIWTLQSQLAQVRGMSSKEAMDQLVTPVRIELEGMSGGYDGDGKPGDDGIALFIRPIDRDGHVIKAAGSLKVSLLDPLNPPNHNVVAEYYFDVPMARKLWYGRLWTNHFTVRCPWPSGQMPMHNELTAHVVFTDLLTGKALTAQQAYPITLPVAVTSVPSR